MQDPGTSRCRFCNAVLPISLLVVCESESCHDAHRAEIKLDELDYLAYLRVARSQAMLQRCKFSDEKSGQKLRRLKRWFYTVKAVICLRFTWLRWFTSSPEATLKTSLIKVAEFAYKRRWEEQPRKQLVVGAGLFCNWWYELQAEEDQVSDVQETRATTVGD